VTHFKASVYGRQIIVYESFPIYNKGNADKCDLLQTSGTYPNHKSKISMFAMEINVYKYESNCTADSFA